MQLTATVRDLSKPAKTLRAQGLIPGELYGKGVANVHLALTQKDFRGVFKQAGETSIVTVSVDGASHPVLIHDVSYDAITGEPTHVDLYRVQAGQKIRTAIPVEFTGEAPAVKLGAVVTKAVSEIEVEAAADKLPRVFMVDLSSLTEIGMGVRISDLQISSDVKVFADGETTIVSVAAQKEEVEEPAPAVDLSTIATEGDIKKAEREAKKTEKEEE